jgi:hypothetical protein
MQLHSDSTAREPMPAPRAKSHRSIAIFAAVATLGALGLLTVEFARMRADDAERWSLWLQNLVNSFRVIEICALAFGAYQFWVGRNERRASDEAAVFRARKDANYQAWQVINSAQGKGGSGGRIDALADLVRNDVSLSGINLDGAWLEGIDLRGAALQTASFETTNLQSALFDGARLDGASFRGATLVAASFVGANLKGVDFAGARLSAANFAGADLTDARGWREIVTLAHANVDGMHAAPRGFLEWARANGAVDSASERSLDERGQSQEFRIL